MHQTWIHIMAAFNVGFMSWRQSMSLQMIATSYLIVPVKWNFSRYILACKRQCRP